VDPWRRVAALIERLFHTRYTLRGVSYFIAPFTCRRQL
jgi:hypothetical protein